MWIKQRNAALCLGLLSLVLNDLNANAAELASRNSVLISTDLQKAINDAVNTYPTVASGKANVEAVGADLTTAKWARFPSLTIEGLAYRESANTNTSNSQDSLQATAILDQPLWTGGVISGNIDRATYEQEAALAGLGEAILGVELQATESFFEVQRQQARQEIIRKSIADHQALVDMMRRRVEQEVSPNADLELVSSRLAQMQLQLSVAISARNSAIQKLRDLVGNPNYAPPLFISSQAQPPQFVLESLIADALAFNPKYQRFKADAKVAQAAYQVSKGQILPKLDLQYSYNDVTGNRVGLVLKSQFSGGLSSVSASEASKMRQVSSKLQVNATEREIRNLMVADYEDYTSLRSRLIAANSASQASQRISESYMRQFTSGLRTWLDLMNSVRESTVASLDALDASIGAEAALTRIILRTGLWKAEVRE
jgi:adhesin transport system outer membrane protein